MDGDLMVLNISCCTAQICICRHNFIGCKHDLLEAKMVFKIRLLLSILCKATLGE